MAGAIDVGLFALVVSQTTARPYADGQGTVSETLVAAVVLIAAIHAGWAVVLTRRVPPGGGGD